MLVNKDEFIYTFQWKELKKIGMYEKCVTWHSTPFLNKFYLKQNRNLSRSQVQAKLNQRND